MDLKNKHILITQLRLFDFAGSETVTLELAEEFSRRGATVSVVTGGFGEPIVGEFEKIKNVRLYGVNDPNFVKAYKKQPVDVAWIHHQIIPDVVLENATSTKFVFNHMSAMLGIEMPIFYDIEHALADRIIFNSQGTLNKTAEQGYVKRGDPRLGVLYNASPRRFVNSTLSENATLTCVGIVSNHIPEEAEKALDILEEQHGITVFRFGAHTEIRKRIEPSDIAKCDVVFTIGKTVQYAIAGNRPVYCYDRFGGPGYLNKDNVELAMKRNFSGRGFSQRSGQEIAQEIIEGYVDARAYTTELSDSVRDTINLEFRIDQILETLAVSKKPHKKSISGVELASYQALRELIIDGHSSSVHAARSHTAMLRKQISHQKGIIETKDTEIQHLQGEVRKVSQEIAQLKRSHSFRLGRAIGYPYRVIKRGVKRNDK